MKNQKRELSSEDDVFKILHKKHAYRTENRSNIQNINNYF